MVGPVVGVVTLMFGVYHAYLCVFSFLADAYGPYASSALASQSFLRNLFGFASPLLTTPLYENLGYQWASSLLGFIGLALGVVPFVLFFYGYEIRARSKYSRLIALQEAEARERLRAREEELRSKQAEA